jgi:GxxExxY protein
MTKKQINQISGAIVDSAYEVHSQLGPGLLEAVYSACMIDSLISKGLKVEVEKAVKIEFKGKSIKNPLRLDLLVEGCVIVELKAVEVLNPIFTAQLLTYLKLSKMPKGLLINFNTKLIKYGIKSLVNEYFAGLPEE